MSLIIRELALDRLAAETTINRTATPVPELGGRVVKPTVLLDEPGLQVRDEATVPTAFLSPDELARREIECTPLPDIEQIIEARYAALALPPAEYKR